MKEISKSIILFGGNSLPPNGVPVYEAFKQIGCIIYVDMDTHDIVDASFTTVNILTNQFLQQLLIGYNLKQGIHPLISEMNERLQLVSKKAFIKAIEACYHRYVDYCEKRRKK